MTRYYLVDKIKHSKLWSLCLTDWQKLSYKFINFNKSLLLSEFEELLILRLN